LEYLYNLISFRLNAILPTFVCVEIILILMLCRKKGKWFNGGNLIFAAMILFFLGALGNLLTSFGLFIVPADIAGVNGAYTVHPLLAEINFIIHIPAWILCGIGVLIWYRATIKKRIN
jgi:hypothetical protein